MANHGRGLLQEIQDTACKTPTLWFLGHSGFVLKYLHAIIYIDPLLSRQSAPFAGSEVTHAGLVLCTHAHAGHLDPLTVNGILGSSPQAKLVIPKAAAEHAHSLGIGYQRMVTTNSDLRVEFRDDRIYAVPSAHEQLDWTPLGGYPYLGYLVRFGRYTIYHAGDCVPYDGLAQRLRPYNVTVALLPVSGRPGNFQAAEAAQLAEDIGAQWLAPMHYTDPNPFLSHMLGHRPAQKFKVFECGERWTVPEISQQVPGWI